MLTYWSDNSVALYHGDVLDVLRELPPESVQMAVTSPPYYALRDYGVEGQIGLEATPDEYVCRMVGVFHELRRVLRDDGVLWLNIGDTYNGSGGAGGDYNKGGLKEGQPRYPGHHVNGLKPKDLIGIPWMLAFALRADGWWLRSDIIWSKPNPMPESVTDRPTKSHEYLFLLSKRATYYYDADAIREPHLEEHLGRYKSVFWQEGTKEAAGSGRLEAAANTGGFKEPNPAGRNARSVWEITTHGYPGAHFATFPEALVEPCILAGSAEGDTVLDPFMGSGTTAWVAKRLGRKAVGIELNEEYLKLAIDRNRQGALL